MITVEGKCGIRATVVCDSISEVGVRLTTFEIEYPRLILAELNTHRMLSKNSASSRAIPFAKMKEQLTGRPVRFGKNVAGMQDSGEHNARVEFHDNDFGYGVMNSLSPEHAWDVAKENAVRLSEAFAEVGYHKQVYNRLTEPFQMMKTVISATEWDNFFWLRDHGAADPTLQELARCMREAREQSKPQVLKAGEWHLPYVTVEREDDGTVSYKIGDGIESGVQYLSPEDAIKVSCARCCAVSFRNTDYGLEKSKEVYKRLTTDEKIHGSALEHCATPMKGYRYEWAGPNANTTAHVNNPEKSYTWEKGISHTDRNGNLWSGNFKGWVQFRKTIPGENYKAC